MSQVTIHRMNSRAAQMAKRAVQERLGQQWKAGGRLPPLTELARMLGTGQRNLHRAVQELVAEGVLVSAPRLGTFVAGSALAAPQGAGAVSVVAAGSLEGKAVQTWSPVVASDPMIDRMVGAFAAAIQAAGGQVQRQFLDSSLENKAPMVAPDAAAIVYFNPHRCTPLVAAPHQPMVIVSTSAGLNIRRAQGFDVVTLDEDHGGYLAGEHLRGEGVCRVCFVGRIMDGLPFLPHRLYDLSSTVRLTGFERGWGQSVPHAHRLSANFYGESWGARAVAQYMALSDRPDGVFAASDEIAVGFVAGALAHGFEPGRDFKLIGFDGQDRGRAMAEGPLTSVDAPAAEMGRRAAVLIADRLRYPDQAVRRIGLGCHIRVGKTTRSTSS